MKVILNHDVPNLGELGDVKDVAAGYARNFLFPRNLAFLFSPKTIQLFQRRQAEIESLKAGKRQASLGLKEKLEADEISLTLPAGANGKLYGAVTSHSIADELLKKGIEVDRKRIEVPGRSIKSVGNYKVLVRLYEKDEATVRVSIIGQAVKTEKAEEAPRPPRRRRYEEQREAEAQREDAPEAPAEQ